MKMKLSIKKEMKVVPLKRSLRPHDGTAIDGSKAMQSIEGERRSSIISKEVTAATLRLGELTREKLSAEH
jgi:hypothetical protein